MKVLAAIAKIGDKILGVLTTLFAIVVLLYSLYAIYDMYYVNRNAYSSFDLQKYKPVITTPGEDQVEGVDFKSLMELNPDAAGWITVKDTHIDYPVVQGKNDLEYAAKDVYGEASLTGAIYLSTENRREILDCYNVIYGHHMDNGAMFGDLEKYKDEKYFRSHQDGVFYTPDRSYRLKAFAVVLTDAYDEVIYRIHRVEAQERLDYIKDISLHYDPVSIEDIESILEYAEVETEEALDSKKDSSLSTQLIALSTCEDATTNGRIVVICAAYPETIHEEIVTPAEPSVIGKMTAVGHPYGTDYWAFLNLVCLVMTIITLVPLHRFNVKIRLVGILKKAKKLYTGYGYAGQDAMDIVDYGKEARKDLLKNRRKSLIGFLIEVLIVIIAITAFFLSEDMTRPVIMCDGFTPLMLFFFGAAWLVEYFCFRYKGKELISPEEVLELAKEKRSKEAS
ncbi:MAG: class B sortase [Lachnospiraceae bacterium]|nr:class B sortase [Lachnospiraceae bacterium]